MTTGPPRTTPVVPALCACAAIGALIAAATVAIASILFRMLLLLQGLMRASLTGTQLFSQFPE